MENESLMQIGSSVIEISSSAICLNGKEELIKFEIENLKNKIKDYIITNKKIRVSDIAEIFNVSPRLVGQALKELEKEGLIKEVD